MSTAVLITLIILLVFIVYVAHGLFTMTLNDFLEKKIIVKTIWLWLPFHALWRLSKEFKEKYLK